jgi:uncharacterized membrane protein
MASIEKSIDVQVPLRTVYNQWTQFEDFPHFMEGIDEVRQLNDTQLYWRATIAGKTEEWNAKIIEQTTDQQIAWESTSGARNAGAVSFQAINPSQTRVFLRLDYEPEGMLEKIGDLLGFVDGRVEGDLKRFKEFIEARGQATGAWRGEVQDGQRTN